MRQTMNNNGLFKGEERHITTSAALLDASAPNGTIPRDDYATLVHAYRKLLRQMKRVVWISDHQQEELRILNQEKDQLLNRLEELSLTDGLTSIPNRRRFDQFLDFEWKRAQRIAQPLSLLLMDIDHFKLYNDNYGHAAGDQCLKTVATTLHSALRRPTDLLARYGGEEFACVLTDTTTAGTESIARLLLNTMREHALPHRYSLVDDIVTLSIGSATLIPKSGQTCTELIRMADDLLYQAKKNGRNQYCCSTTELTREP
jgi:diguanylate cyclase (GGDEF)-like protein